MIDFNSVFNEIPVTSSEEETEDRPTDILRSIFRNYFPAVETDRIDIEDRNLRSESPEGTMPTCRPTGTLTLRRRGFTPHCSDGWAHIWSEVFA